MADATSIANAACLMDALLSQNPHPEERAERVSRRMGLGRGARPLSTRGRMTLSMIARHSGWRASMQAAIPY
jgi:hypothetical protein